MYHKTLHISLFGVSEAVGQTIDAQEPYPRFRHETHSYAAFDPNAFADSDIVVIDADSWRQSTGQALSPAADLGGLVPAWRDAHGERFCILIVVASLDERNAYTADDFAVIDAVWVTPLTQPYLENRISTLFLRAHLRSESLLHNTYFSTLIDSVPDMIWFKTLNGTHLKVNDFFCSVVNKSKEDVIGRGHNYIWGLPEDDTESAEICAKTEALAIEAGHMCSFEEEITTPEGRRKLKTYKAPLYDEDGTVMGTVGMGHDITELGNIQNELNILIDSIPLSVIIEDANDVIAGINALTEQYFEIERANSIGRSFSEWRRDAFGEKLARIREHHESEEFLLTKGDSVRLLYMRKAPILDVFGNPTGRIRLYSDMTEQRELENQALQNARTDYLTGLYNRRYFYEALAENESADSTAIMIMDLDNFKGINDTYGHTVGDHLLVLAANILKDVFAENVVVRWGGDEFVASMRNVSSVDEVCEKAQRFLDLIAEQSEQSCEMCKVTGSVGVVVDFTGTEPIDELIKRADDALYAAKSSGKSCLRVG
ncbi:sensor domain-containing diguanylate cyclase [Xiamenia xianingshaonis]|uniref:Diguanylate cyclase n=1 Tax=Xiamenia xianingshaonis TaxID=2682776 RepID=A0A9E6MR93_9ACTN|nr:sensor domain-containing diguanylate cyclase [Xiamenia xianingshaonis]NHM13288.1 diguanylate cyclase [Xiamenia xianingshaonis]QTU84628.1 diguanylate cyclase [Xiamenia xianingshaonis]